MSGIAISDDAVNLFYYMKAKSTYRWAMWGVNGNGSEVTCDLNAVPVRMGLCGFACMIACLRWRLAFHTGSMA